MATRTAKGTVKQKASGTTLTLSSVSLSKAEAVIAIVGWQGTVVPTVAAGTRNLKRVIQRTNSGSGFGAAIFYARQIKNASTRDIVATWSTAATGKVMVVLTVDTPLVFYEGAGNKENTASPTTSANLLDLPVHDCFHLGGLVAQGPSGDAAVTLASDWTLGQRDGTAGAPPVSNITITEGFKVGRCIDPEEMTSTGSQTRDWCNVLATFKPRQNVPAIDGDGTEIEIGDTVEYANGAGTSTVSSFTDTDSGPLVKVTLANGLVYNAHTLVVQ